MNTIGSSMVQSAGKISGAQDTGRVGKGGLRNRTDKLDNKPN